MKSRVNFFSFFHVRFLSARDTSVQLIQRSFHDLELFVPSCFYCKPASSHGDQRRTPKPSLPRPILPETRRAEAVIAG